MDRSKAVPILLVAVLLPGIAQTNKNQPRRERDGATAVTVSAGIGNDRAYIGVFACEQQPQTKRTATLVSKSDAGAYLEARVRVVATRRDNPEDEPSHKCRADWTLYVAAPGAKNFAAVPVYGYAEKDFVNGFAADASTYYGGSVMGWSPDGELLLGYAHIGAYEDWFLPIPVVYSMSEKKAWAVDLRAIFAKRTKQDCDLHFDPLGFSADGKVVVDIAPFDYVDQSCFRHGRWLLDFRTGAMIRTVNSAQAKIEFKSAVGKNE